MLAGRIAEPLSIYVDTHGTGTVDEAKIEAVLPQLIGVLEQSNGLNYRVLTNYNNTAVPSFTYRVGASYVTGSHAFKFGFQEQNAFLSPYYSAPADYEINLVRGVPNQVIYLPTPYRLTNYAYKSSAYGQDQWRVNRLTLNLGIRWEYHSPWVEVADRQSNFDLITGKILLAGKDGKFLTSRHLVDRLEREILGNVSIKLFATGSPDVGAERFSVLTASARSRPDFTCWIAPAGRPGVGGKTVHAGFDSAFAGSARTRTETAADNPPWRRPIRLHVPQFIRNIEERRMPVHFGVRRFEQCFLVAGHAGDNVGCPDDPYAHTLVPTRVDVAGVQHRHFGVRRVQAADMAVRQAVLAAHEDFPQRPVVHAACFPCLAA